MVSVSPLVGLGPGWQPIAWTDLPWLAAIGAATTWGHMGLTRAYAAAHAAVLTGLLGAAVLASIPLWKRVIERYRRLSAIGASLSMAGVGYLCLSLLVNPFQGLAVLPVILIGAGHAGSMVALQVLTVDLTPRPVLGAMLGLA